MTRQQKKWGSLAVAVLIVLLFSLLTGCSSKADDEQKQKDEAIRQFMHQEDGTVRKPGEKGMKGY
jgi:outer membrane biogenesis lipoprotein LolB